jgi:hypothetical protein
MIVGIWSTFIKVSQRAEPCFGAQDFKRSTQWIMQMNTDIINPLSLFIRVKKWLSLNRLEVIHEQYLAVMEGIVAKNAKEQEEIAFYSREFLTYYARTSRLVAWRVVLYGVLYASIVVSILQFIPFLSVLAEIISWLGAYVGGIAFVLIFLATIRINVHLQRLQACLMPLVVLHQLNPKRDTRRSLHRLSRVI